MKSKVGTLYYLAPEVFEGSYDAKCDVWSLGIMLYKMLTGNFPFKGDTDEQILNNIRVGQVNFALPEWKNLKRCPALDVLIRRMLTANPEVRITAKVALAELNVWLQEIEKREKEEYESGKGAMAKKKIQKEE